MVALAIVGRVGARLEQHPRQLGVAGDPGGAVQRDLEPVAVVDERGVRIGAGGEQAPHDLADPRRPLRIAAQQPRETGVQDRLPAVRAGRLARPRPAAPPAGARPRRPRRWRTRTRGRGGRAPGSASSSARARRRSADVTDAISAAARSAASRVSASTWNFSRGHERNPYSRAIASCASAIDGNSPALRRRLASSRRWRRSGRAAEDETTRLGHVSSSRSPAGPHAGPGVTSVTGASASHHSWACGPFRGPGASCTHPVTIPDRRATERVRGRSRPVAANVALGAPDRPDCRVGWHTRGERDARWAARDGVPR